MVDNKLILFDMDGTLLDTIVDLAEVCNKVLVANGFPVHSVECYKGFVGKGAKNLIQNALAACTDNPKIVQNILDQFKETYFYNANIHTKPYDGIPQVLQSLRLKGYKIGILSNKPHPATSQMADAFFPKMIDFAYGQREGIPIKPDPTALFEILNQYNVDKSNCIFIGDSEVDVATAHNANVACVAVSWGFRTSEALKTAGATVIIDKVDQLEEKIIDIFARDLYTNNIRII